MYKYYHTHTLLLLVRPNCAVIFMEIFCAQLEVLRKVASPLGTILERGVLYRQPTGPNALYHRDDLVDRSRAMRV